MPSQTSRIKILLGRFAKPGVIVSCCLLLAILASAYPPADPGTKGNVGIDTSWLVGLPAALQQRQVSGRDFFFTYGFFNQVQAWAAMRITASRSAFLAYPAITIFSWFSSLTLLGVLLLSIRQIDWKRALFLFVALTVLNIPLLNTRTFMILLCAVLLSYSLAASHRRTRFLLAVATGGSCLIAQLYVLDAGLYSLGTAVIVLLGCAVLARLTWRRPDLHTSKHYLELLGAFLGAFTLGNLLISVIFALSTPNYMGLFDYQRYALESVRGYNNTMGVEWGLSNTATFVLFALAVFIIIFLVRFWRRIPIADACLLLSLITAAVLQVKGAIVRSDAAHILQAFGGVVFVFLLVGRVWLEMSKLNGLWIALAVSLIIIWPGASLSTFQNYSRLIEGSLSPFKGLQDSLSVQNPPEEILPEGMVVLQNHPEPLLNFPYENYIAIVLNRKLVAPVLQSYAAHTETLQKMYVGGLEKAKPELEVIYGLDSVVSANLDGVQNITRVPIIFEYLYRNFELTSAQKYGRGYYLLQRRKQAREIAATNLSFKRVAPSEPTSKLLLDQPTPCTLVRLSVKIVYPLTSWVGRPNPIGIGFFSDGNLVTASKLVAIETGKEFTTYVSLIEPNRFYQVFGDEGAQSRVWDYVELAPQSTGLFGVSPDQIEVPRVECVNLQPPAPALTDADARADLTDPDLWHPINIQAARIQDGKVVEWQVGDDPILIYEPPVHLCLDDYSHFYVRMGASTGEASRRFLQIFYLLDGETQWGPHVITIALEADSRIYDYFYDVKSLGLKPGLRLTGLRLDPIASNSPKSDNLVRLVELRLIKRPDVERSQCAE